MATKPTKSTALDEIKRLRAEYVRGDAGRSAILDEALEQKRAEAVAERILALEAELNK